MSVLASAKVRKFIPLAIAQMGYKKPSRALRAPLPGVCFLFLFTRVLPFGDAIAINENYADAYYDRGKARFELGDNQGAIEDFTQAIAINENYARA